MRLETFLSLDDLRRKGGMEGTTVNVWPDSQRKKKKIQRAHAHTHHKFLPIHTHSLITHLLTALLEKIINERKKKFFFCS